MVVPSMTDRKCKSPSRLKRDQLRIKDFNGRKMKESLEIELKKKTRTILKLEVEISNLKFKMFKPRPKLSIRKVLNQEYKPVEDFLRTQLPKPKLTLAVTSNTCDTPACQYRRRPCHALTPASQFYHDFMWCSKGFPLQHIKGGFLSNYNVCVHHCTPSNLLMYINVLLIRC